jgi:hypothetical protein
MFVHFLSVAFIWKSTVDYDHSILPGTEISIIRRGNMRTNVLLILLYTVYTLQRHNSENLKHIFPGQELRGYSPNSYIHVSVSDLYIPLTGLPILLQDNR